MSKGSRRIRIIGWMTGTLLSIFYLHCNGAWAEEALSAPSPNKLLSRISLFNPLGRAFNSLEEAVPGLTLKGLLRNRTRLNLHGTQNLGFDDLESGLGRRRSDRFPSIEWLGELELRYRPSPYLELVNVDNLLYDAAFDWTDSDYPHHVERKLEYYSSADRILRELYATLFYNNWEVKAGKQQLVWGKMDGKVIDIINPADTRYAVGETQDNYEWTRLPLWMLNVTHYWSDSYLQLLWIPSYRSGEGPPLGGPFSLRLPPFPPSVRRLTRNESSSAFVNQEWGVRANTVRRGWDVSLVYFYTWNDFSTLFRRGIDRATGKTLLEPKPTRLHQFGLDLDKSLWFLKQGWILRVESVLTLNDYLAKSNESRTQDGVTKVNRILSALAIETSWPRQISSILQIQQRQVFKYDGHLRSLGKRQSRDEWTVLLALSKTFKSTDDRLKLSWTSGLVDDGSGTQRYALDYILSDYLSLMCRYWGFYGHRDDLLGMFRDRDYLDLMLKYEF